MRKGVNFWQLGFIYAGCFLGAGYMSGQELWQFFGVFGDCRYKGLLLALLMIFIFGSMLLRLICRKNSADAAEIVFGAEHKKLGFCLNMMLGVFLYAVIIIMAAGAGALAGQMFNLPIDIAASVFCFFCAVLSLGGIRSLGALFSLLVPFLAGSAIIISLKIIAWLPPEAAVLGDNANFFLPAWYVGAIIFSAHNIFGALGVLLPFGGSLKDTKNIIGGVLIGVGVLGIIAFLALEAMSRLPECTQKPLPMLYLAAYCGDGWGLLYAWMLFGAMLAAALAPMVALEELFAQKLCLSRKTAAFILATFGSLGALGGFDNLVGIVYTFCGYFGLLVLIGIAVNFSLGKKDEPDC